MPRRWRGQAAPRVSTQGTLSTQGHRASCVKGASGGGDRKGPSASTPLDPAAWHFLRAFQVAPRRPWSPRPSFLLGPAGCPAPAPEPPHRGSCRRFLLGRCRARPGTSCTRLSRGRAVSDRPAVPSRLPTTQNPVADAPRVQRQTASVPTSAPRGPAPRPGKLCSLDAVPWERGEKTRNLKAAQESFILTGTGTWLRQFWA